MRTLLIIICSLLIISVATAQEFVTDESIETTVMAEDDQLKILYFTASWCGPCRYMTPIMISIQEDPSLNVAIYKLDIDKNKTDNILGVSSVPTYFFMKNGRLLGRTGGARQKTDMVKLIQRYDATKVSGELLAYRGKPSQYEIVAGTHPRLTVKNLETIWHNSKELNRVSKEISQVLTDPKDIEYALVLIQRSIELETTTSNLSTYAHLLNKSGDSKKAMKMAKKARKNAIKNEESTQIIDDFIAQLQA